MLARLLFVLFSTFAVLTASIASGQAQQAIAPPYPHLTAKDSSVFCDSLPALFAEDDNSLALAASDGEDGTAIEFQHGLPTEEINAAVSPVPVRLTILRARTSAPRAPPAQV